MVEHKSANVETCPKCGLGSGARCERCRCGYEFATGRIGTPGRIDRQWRRPPSPRLTFFHVLWFAVVFAVMFLSYGETVRRHFGVPARVAAVVLSGVFAFPVVGLLVFLLVVGIVIPRVGQLTSWHYDVECYMLATLGNSWRQAGQRAPSSLGAAEQREAADERRSS